MVGSPLFAWGLALLAFALAMVAEFFADRMLAGGARGCAATFIVGCFLWACFVALRIVHDHGEQRTSNTLKRRYHLVRSILELPEVAESIVVATLPQQARRSDGTKAEREDLAKALCRFLDAFSALTARFVDRNPKSYGANLFITIGVPDLPPAELKAHCDQTFHCLPLSEEGWTDQRALLLLTKELHRPPGRRLTRSAERQFILPVPMTAATESGAKRFLPGAPESFLERQMCTYESINGLVNAADEFTGEVRRAIADHFDKHHGRGVRSFLSIPVLDPEDPTVVVGVLNVDCSDEGILGDIDSASEATGKEVRADYAMLAQVLVAAIAPVVARYRHVFKTEFLEGSAASLPPHARMRDV